MSPEAAADLHVSFGTRPCHWDRELVKATGETWEMPTQTTDKAWDQAWVTTM